MYYGERFNAYSHLAGSVLALSGAVALIVLGALRGDVWKIVSFAIYGASLYYVFTTQDKLIADFQRDITRWNHENRNT